MAGELTPAQRQAVKNERLKLLAQALDRASTAVLVIGVFGPLAADGLTVRGGVIWLLGGLALHAFAQVSLGRMRP